MATGDARTAIGVVRLSGPGAARCAGQIFTAADGRDLSEHPPRALIYGTLLDREGRPVDKVLATWSPQGASYTGEETAELQCHGSPQVLALALEALFDRGARQAGPGEFTRRAFLNGRLDLTQAEAVMDLIDAQTPAAARQAAGQLSGALSRRVEGIYNGLVDVMAHFHAVLDYPDEDIGPFTQEGLFEALSRAQEDLNALLETYDRGRVTREGVPCAIVGPPNAGKSSLLNALVGYDRAIVTDIPGTTRDTVEEKCVLGGVLLRLIDTAGLREAADPVERLGVERSRRAMEGAGLILVVRDQSQGATDEDVALLERSRALAPTILVVNKSDLPPAEGARAGAGTVPCVTGSLIRDPDEMIRSLGKEVAGLFPQGEEGKTGDLLTNARQAEAARRALTTVSRAGEALGLGVPPDALLTDVEEALAALGELTGRTVREDVTGRIFERFCVGK